MKVPGPAAGTRPGRGRLLSPQFAHAARVPSAATLIIALVYAGCVTALNLVVTSRLTGQTDARLADRLAEVSRSGRVTQAPKDGDNDDDGDVDDAPLFLWLIGPGGRVLQLGEDTPPLPPGLRPGRNWPVTTSIGGARSGSTPAAPGAGGSRPARAWLRTGTPKRSCWTVSWPRPRCCCWRCFSVP